jgi:hypothetical protein
MIYSLRDSARTIAGGFFTILALSLLTLALSLPALAQTVYYCADDSKDWIYRSGSPCPPGYRRTWQDEYDAWLRKVGSQTYCLRLNDMQAFIATTRYCPSDSQSITRSDYEKFLEIERDYQ